jgi:two-component system sensor histidine kinase KdpD
VFVNLLENAARYTPRGTSIEITAAADDKWLQIAIADRGPGLPYGLEERIFEKFFRASPTVDAGRGSGLGLAICRAIVKAHGGKLTATNRPGGGAVFIVRLPVAKNPPRVVVE